MHYIALIHKDGDSAYGVQFPDVPGCFSAADRLEDVKRQAAEALSLHLEGEDAPAPRDLDTVATDPRVKRELAEGAMLMAIPFFTRAGNKPFTGSMPGDLLAAVDEAAKAAGKTRSAFLADAAKDAILNR